MNKPLKTIVIGTSLTDASDGVVRTGIALARTTGASVWLVHAYTPFFGTPGPGMDVMWTVEQTSNLRELIDKQAERTGLSTLAGFSPDKVLLAIGSPHREIVDLARRLAAGLIVLGASEHAHGFLGSTADRVIRKAPCPVLAVRSEIAFRPSRVELPVDFSPVSANALRQGIEFLVRLGVPATAMEALFVLNPLEVGGSIQFSPEQIERFAGEELRRFLEANAPEGACPQASVRTGYPREEILAAIAERSADLAVLGTHGRGGFERLVIGSVATGVLRGTSCNLLVVPPEAPQQQPAAAGQEVEAGADWTYVSDESPVGAGSTWERP